VNWWEHAACKGRTELSWFASDNRQYDLSSKAEALALCSGCRVRAACLEDALSEGNFQFGIRGGLTAKERLDMPRRRFRVSVAECGTDAGYYRHLRKLQETACGPCKRAHADAQSLRKPEFRPA
jgi:WhiB family redox-sensing transcriptional regulator